MNPTSYLNRINKVLARLSEPLFYFFTFFSVVLVLFILISADLIYSIILYVLTIGVVAVPIPCLFQCLAAYIILNPNDLLRKYNILTNSIEEFKVFLSHWRVILRRKRLSRWTNSFKLRKKSDYNIFLLSIPVSIGF